MTNNHISATNSKFNEIYGVQVAGAPSQPITFGSVSNNSLTLNNVTLRKVGNKSSFIYAIAQDVTGGNSRQIGDYPTVNNGTLTISGNFTVVEAGSAQIGAARTSVLNVSNNNLLIENATVKFQQGIAELFGGKTTYAATSDNNSVRISNSKVLIGSSTITGGEATEGSANGNNVTIEKNSEVNASLIVGAFAAESVTNASILIDSSKVSGNIAIFDGKPSTDGDGSITIRGDSDLSSATLLPYVSKSYKGNADTTLVLDEFSGNVRNLGYSATSDSFKSSGFDHIRMLNQNWDTSKAILNVEGNAVIRKSSFTDESLSFTNSESVKQGGTITLIKGDLTYLDPDEVNERELKSTAGTSLEFSGILNFDQENITYTIGEVDNSYDSYNEKLDTLSQQQEDPNSVWGFYQDICEIKARDDFPTDGNMTAYSYDLNADTFYYVIEPSNSSQSRYRVWINTGGRSGNSSDVSYSLESGEEVIYKYNATDSNISPYGIVVAVI